MDDRLKWAAPVASLIIGTVALFFQVFVLYPWHDELSREFADLRERCIKA
jgi:hypothetical protein